MKTIIKDVQGFVASLFPSIHRVAAPSHRWLQLSLLTLILTLGTGQMWGDCQISNTTKAQFYNSYTNSCLNLTNADNNHYYGDWYMPANKTYNCKFLFGGSNWGYNWYVKDQNDAYTWTGSNDVTTTCFKDRSSNDKFTTASAASGWTHLYLDLWASYSWGVGVKFYYTAVTALSGSLTANNTTVVSGDEVTLTKTASGGTGTPTTSYTSSPSLTISNNKFTAPIVTSNTNYTITLKIQDPNISAYNITKTVTITVQPKTYTVTLNTNSGTINAGDVTSYIYSVGATLPTNVTRTGYKFAGWYDNESLTGSPVTSISTSDTGNKTYWAKWLKTTVSGTMSPNPATANTTTLFTFNVTISNWVSGNRLIIINPANGYLYGPVNITTDNIEWTSGALSYNSGTQTFKLRVCSASSTDAITDDYTINLSVSAATYSVSVGVSPAGYGTVSPTSVTASPDSWSAEITATPNAGYRFDNWTNGANVTLHAAATTNPIKIKASAASTLTANFTPATYRVSLNNQSATTTGTEYVDVVYNTTTLSTISKPEKTNYTFMGYYTETDGGGTQIIDANGNWLASKTGFTDSSKNSLVTENKTLYAYWTEKTHTVNVQVATGQDSWGIVSPASVNAGEVNYVTDITATAHETKGYYFVNWTATDGITIQDATNRITRVIATKDGTLTANFEGRNRETDVYLTGTMNSWAESDANWRFVKLPGEERHTVTLTKTINRGDYSASDYAIAFKIYHSDWDIKSWTNAENATKMTASNFTNWPMNIGSGVGNNTSVDLSVSGDYTFTITNSNVSSQQRLTVTYPDKSFLEGTFNSWSETANLLVTDGAVQRCTINIASVGDYQFRLVSHSVAYKNSTKFERTSNTKTLTAMNMTETPASFNAPVPGNYIFAFNTSTKSLTITYPTGNYLRGGFNNWGWDIPLTATSNAYEYAATVSLTGEQAEHLFSGEDGFKVVYDGVHYGKKSTTIDGNNRTASGLLTSDGNIALATAYPGDYTFTFNSSSKNLTVDYPDIPDMSGTLSFNPSQPGKVCGTGTNESPFLVFQGETLTLQATHNSAPETATEHIYYQYTVNSVAQTAKQGDRTYSPSTSSTTSKIPFTVKAYYQYGPENHKVQGTPVTSTTYYYKVIDKPTVSITIPSKQAEKGVAFAINVSTTHTDVSCLLNHGPWYTLQWRKWNGSAWGDWTNYTNNPETSVTSATIGALNTEDNKEGFYQWRVKMNYGGTSAELSPTFYSSAVQNVIYKPCQVTIEENSNAVGWFKGLYAYRTSDSFNSLCAYQNSAYPGQYFKDCCVEVGDNKYVYILKYPIYTHIILNDNTSSDANKTADIPITNNTCITLTGQKFSGTNNWAFTRTPNCGDAYYRIRTTYTPNSTTYYSNIVPQGSEAQLSFFAAQNGSGVLTFQKLENGRWIDKQTLTSPPQSGIYNATYNGSDGIKNNAITENNDPLYIRTDAAAGGWEDYTNADNIMNHFTPRSNYDYYWVTYTGDGLTKNIDAEIGNSINKCLARRIEDRSVYADANGCVYEKNVRFSYDSQNNWFDYAVIGASTNTSYTFLSTYGADAQGATASTRVFKLTDSQEKGTATKENDPSNQVKFSDLSNWVYQADVWAVADGTNAVTIAIEARLPGLTTVQQIVDRAQPLTTLGATTTAGSYIIRILYDYKTNTITTGWLPKNGENITGDKTIAGNMILNRGETTSVEQLTLNDGVTVSGLRKLYMALKLDKTDLNKGEPYSSSYIHYIWFSLPYDCKVSDIFGAPGKYPDDWEIWEYDGAERARKGLLDDASFFKNVPFNRTLEANKGYCLGLLLNENRFKTIVMDDVARSSIYIYFPSQEDGYTLRNSATKQLVVPAQYDEAFFTRRPDRKKYDRDWNLMGVPSYNDISSITAPDAGVEHTYEAASAPGFIYDYLYTGGTAGSSENNKYKYIAVNSNAAGFKYKAFFSYMMQYAGTITWTSNSIENIKAAPAPRKPVRTGEHQLTQATLNLQLLANDEWLDNTFVSLLPQATDKVDHNIDLVKIWNSGSSQLCSLSEDVELAANCLSVDSQTVDLRVYIDNTRTYTFRLEEKVPDGLIALLEDTEAHTLTDLGSDAYTVDLMQGTYDGRFRLHLIVGRSDIGTDIDQLTNSVSYTLYGNEFLLNALTEPVSAALYDPAGRLLYQGIVNPGNTINLPDQAGVYLLRLPTQTLRIVK